VALEAQISLHGSSGKRNKNTLSNLPWISHIVLLSDERVVISP
jgi:hypothetical protein